MRGSLSNRDLGVVLGVGASAGKLDFVTVPSRRHHTVPRVRSTLTGEIKGRSVATQGWSADQIDSVG